MKINFVLYGNTRFPGGGPKVIYEYANYLSKHHEVNLCFYGGCYLESIKLPAFVKKLFCRLSYSRRPRWFRLNTKVKKKVFFDYSDMVFGEADAIIATDVRTAKPVSELPAECGKKYYFIQDYENWVLSDEEVLSTYSLGMTNITVSKWLKKLVDRYSDEESACVSNGINTAVFRKTTPLNNRVAHSIVFQYRSSSMKGCDDAIRVVKRIRKLYPDVVVVVPSREKKPDKMPPFVDYRYNVTPEEIARINNENTVFLCTSVNEGFGLPGLEAMACGMVLVSTEYAGVFEYARNNYNALLVKPHDINGLVSMISCVFDDSQIRNRLSDAGVKTAGNRSLQRSAAKFERIIVNNCAAEF